MSAGPSHTKDSAMAVLQAVLDRLTQAVWEDRFDLLVRHTTNPHTIISKDATYIFGHDGVCAKALHQLYREIHEQGVSNMVRLVTSAQWISGDEIHGTYRIWLLNGTTDMLPSYSAHAVVVRTDDGFALARADHSENPSGPPWPMPEDMEPGQDRRPAACPGPFNDDVFRNSLDDLTEPFFTLDGNRFANRFRLPATFVTPVGLITMNTKEDVLRLFDEYIEANKSLQIDRVLREPLGYELCHDNSVIATFRNHLFTQGRHLREPHTASALFFPDKDMWRISTLMNVFGPANRAPSQDNLSGENKT